MACKLVNGTLYLEGHLNSQTVPELEEHAARLIRHEHPSILDLEQVQGIDSAGVAFLDELQHTLGQDSILLIKGANPEVQGIIDTFTTLKLSRKLPERGIGFFEGIGDTLIVGYGQMKELLILSSEVFYWALIGAFNRRGERKGSFVQQAYGLGSQALPIVALLSFIIGFILSLQSAIQLKIFGANVFIAELISVTMVNEMGPMLTAIIVAGRSGSAIASEIATMQVTEEIDALKMMALSPIRYVVVPKFHALMIVMPLLVAFSIIIGILGGLLIAISYLDVSATTFFQRAVDIIALKDLVISFGKSVVFAWAIVIIGSHYGFQVKGGAEGVGKATTTSVVASIFAVILLDAIFSLLYI
ncbi:MAG: MlaE family lipid ABC transporter permease subunit [Candidatus Cloacimonetes bacterium]|nr:MlaE family lipid ABC transporter permease subunit [Candidatus Cloacimonadota bacterium]